MHPAPTRDKMSVGKRKQKVSKEINQRTCAKTTRLVLTNVDKGKMPRKGIPFSRPLHIDHKRQTGINLSKRDIDCRNT